MGVVRICHTIREIATQPVILWILLGGKSKFLWMNFGFDDVMRTYTDSELRQNVITVRTSHFVEDSVMASSGHSQQLHSRKGHVLQRCAILWSLCPTVLTSQQIVCQLEVSRTKFVTRFMTRGYLWGGFILLEVVTSLLLSIQSCVQSNSIFQEGKNNVKIHTLARQNIQACCHYCAG